MRWLAAGLASLLWLAAAPSQAQLKGENLLVAPPPGFKVGFKGSRNDMNMLEWIPASETVQDWTEMVTVQIFVKRADLDPAQFLRQLQDAMAGGLQGQPACFDQPDLGERLCRRFDDAELSAPRIDRQARNDVVPCRQGQRQLLSRPACVRVAAAPELLERLRKYLADVSVCEAGSREHPCPDLKPIGR